MKSVLISLSSVASVELKKIHGWRSVGAVVGEAEEISQEFIVGY